MRTFHGPERAAPMRPSIICLHASAGSGAQWKALANRTRDDFQVLTPDFYGHGTAPAWNGAPTDIVAADAARITRLAADTGGPVHLVGHSYGGAIALRIALRHPESVASVAVYEPVALRVLFDYNRRHRAASEVAETADEIRRALNGGNLEVAAQRFVDYWSGTGQWAQHTPEQRIEIARRMPVIQAHFASLIRDDVQLRNYASVRTPVLYLSGRNTRASARRMSELLECALPDVEFHRLDGMGHLGPITAAETVAQRIAHFVRARAASHTLHDRKAA